LLLQEFFAPQPRRYLLVVGEKNSNNNKLPELQQQHVELLLQEFFSPQPV
jgi:hypothetical protein